MLVVLAIGMVAAAPSYYPLAYGLGHHYDPHVHGYGYFDGYNYGYYDGRGNGNFHYVFGHYWDGGSQVSFRNDIIR